MYITSFEKNHRIGLIRKHEYDTMRIIEAKLLHTILLPWFKKNERNLSWRKESRDAYTVLVSETMLQQTQASRVHEKLPEFLEKFPTIEHLAHASNTQILIAWQGMGYNNRALRLRDSARLVVQKYKGIIPNDFEALISLPGIGRYTASAIMSFAYCIDVPIVDVNIRRVLSRIFYKQNATVDVLDEKTVWRLAEEIIPLNMGAQWHQALMDIGSLFCTANTPKCEVCPLSEHCNSAFGLQDIKKVKKKEPSFRGIPNRLWRGKIVELLRKTENHSVSRDQIIRIVFSSLDEQTEIEWLEQLLDKLKKERIITITQKRGDYYISLSSDI